MDHQKKKIKILFHGFILVLLTVIVYWSVKGYGFIHLDDSVYVIENAFINKGISLQGFVHAFQFPYEGASTYYHPLTVISHMLDCQFFGLNPAGHHLMNLGFHVLNTLLIFWFFQKISHRFFQSALFAAVFAIHPLQLESVVWIAERKNLLSTFFWLLTLLTYVYYIQKPHISKYILLLVLFCLGLLAKPIVMTLPFTLLLLDLWPLKRFSFISKQAQSYPQPNFKGFGAASLRADLHLFTEKIPLFIMTFLWLWVSMHAARSLNESPFANADIMQLRIANAIVSYGKYIIKFFWPFDLAVFYPYPRAMLPTWQIGLALLCLALWTVLVIKKTKSSPYLATGWFWFLGTLFPAIGLTQTGLWPAMADRWMYVPMIGILIAFFGSMEKTMSQWKDRETLLSMIGVTVVFLFGALSHNQITYWRDLKTLFEHAVRVTDKNDFAHYCIGIELLGRNKNQEALQHFQIAEQYNPDSFMTLMGIGHALIALNENLQAIPYLQNVIEKKPKEDTAHYLLGVAYLNNRQPDIALNFFSSAAKLKPDKALYHNGIGRTLLETGRFEAAAVYFLKALALDAQNTEAKNYLIYIRNVRNQTR